MTEIIHKKPSELTVLKRSIVLTRLAAGESVSSISRDLNLNQSHMYAWLSSGEGLHLIQNAVDEANRRIESRLPDLVSRSLDALSNALQSTYDHAPRIAAAKIILGIATKNTKCDACACRNQQSTNE